MLDKADREKLKVLRAAKVSRDGVDIPGSIPFLEKFLENIVDPQEVDMILSAVGNEYAMAGMYSNQLAVTRERVARQPTDVTACLDLANCLSLDSANMEHLNEAKVVAAKAVEFAFAQNIFVRYALTQQAWVAVRSGDASLYEMIIQRLIEEAKSGRKIEIDSGFFAEVVDNVPPGFCTVELADRYRAATGQ